MGVRIDEEEEDELLGLLHLAHVVDGEVAGAAIVAGIRIDERSIAFGEKSHSWHAGTVTGDLGKSQLGGNFDYHILVDTPLEELDGSDVKDCGGVDRLSVSVVVGIDRRFGLQKCHLFENSIKFTPLNHLLSRGIECERANIHISKVQLCHVLSCNFCLIFVLNLSDRKICDDVSVECVIEKEAIVNSRSDNGNGSDIEFDDGFDNGSDNLGANWLQFKLESEWIVDIA